VLFTVVARQGEGAIGTKRTYGAHPQGGRPQRRTDHSGRHFGQWPILRWFSLGHGMSFCRLSRTTLRVEVSGDVDHIERVISRAIVADGRE